MRGRGQANIFDSAMFVRGVDFQFRVKVSFWGRCKIPFWALWAYYWPSIVWAFWIFYSIYLNYLSYILTKSYLIEQYPHIINFRPTSLNRSSSFPSASLGGSTSSIPLSHSPNWPALPANSPNQTILPYLEGNPWKRCNRNLFPLNILKIKTNLPFVVQWLISENFKK